MEESKNLSLARQAIEENNTEDAKVFYLKVRKEAPENGEAKFFYAYCCLYEGKNKEIPSRFSNLCKVVKPSVNYIKESGAFKEEQLQTLNRIVNNFVPETWSLNRYMNHQNTSNITIFNNSDIVFCSKEGMRTLKELGDEIEKLYFCDEEGKRLAVIAWKEYVSLSQKWFAYAVKGDAELYAAKIKKVEPSYEMPKKAGCISFADKR